MFKDNLERIVDTEDDVDLSKANYTVKLSSTDLDENSKFVSVYTLDGLQRSWINRASFGLFDPPKPPQFDTRPRT